MESLCMGHSTIVKAEGSGVVIEEVDKTIDNNIAWSCEGGVKTLDFIVADGD